MGAKRVGLLEFAIETILLDTTVQYINVTPNVKLKQFQPKR